MKKIFKKEQIEVLNSYSQEVVEVIAETIEVLDENYGEKRDVDKDLGGCVLIAENIVDIKILKQDKLQGLVPEYTDLIKCKEGVNWTSSLFLLSSDYSIVVVCTQELSKYLIER